MLQSDVKRERQSERANEFILHLKFQERERAGGMGGGQRQREQM